MRFNIFFKKSPLLSAGHRPKIVKYVVKKKKNRSVTKMNLVNNERICYGTRKKLFMFT